MPDNSNTDARWLGDLITDSERDLLDSWCARSIAAGWPHPSEWWVGAVLECARASSDLERLKHACRHLAVARAQSGIGFAQALDDLDALWNEIATVDAPSDFVRGFALAWADQLAIDLAAAGSRDPLTGVANRGYLVQRCSEVPDEDRSGHVLVVTRFAKPSGAYQIIQSRLAVADCLRRSFPGGSVAIVGRDTLAALCRRDVATGRLTEYTNAVRQELDGELLQSELTAVEMAQLPREETEIAALLTRLAYHR